MARTQTVRVFRYLEDVDAFVVTETYRDIADTLGLSEWTPVVWIGRLFTSDNDFGEHWFDNWKLREEKGLSEDYLLVDPERFKDGRDGPCHSAEFRKRFWTDVLKSLELSFDLICDEARRFNERNRELLEEVAGYPAESFICDLQERIDLLRVKYFG
jgi:hypothetical protein